MSTSRLGIGARITSAILAVLVMGLLVAGIGLHGMSLYDRVAGDMRKASQRAMLAERVNGLILAVVMDSRGIYMARDAAEVDKFAKPMQASLDKLDKLMAEWAALVSAEDAVTMAKAREKADEFKRFRQELARIGREQGNPAARTYGDNDANRTARQALNKFIQELAEKNSTKVSELHASLENVYLTQATLLAGGALAILVAAAAAVLLLRGLVLRPFRGIAAAIHKLAGGDMNARIPHGERKDEIGALAQAAQIFQKNAQHMAEAAQQVTRVAGAVGQVNQAIAQVAEGSSHQVDTIHHLSNAMQETARAVAEVAQSANTASDNMRGAAQLVGDGQERMTEVVEMVRSIAEDSRKISSIAEIIQRIAAQTNMLSLNAAIEAARAGEHGKGFAVVAEEVRKLADVTAGSAGEISALVKEAAREAEEGVVLVANVNHVMQAIADCVRQSDGMMQRIAAAITEQSASIDSIHGNVNDLGRIGAGNAAAAEEITATLNELAHLVETTRAEVERLSA